MPVGDLTVDQRRANAVAALRTLDNDVDSDTDLIDLLDNLEVIASAFDVLLIPRRRWWPRKAKSLDAVLMTIGKGNHVLQELARKVKRQTNVIRKAQYGGFHLDTKDLVRQANELRQELQEPLAKLVPEPEPPDAPEADDD